MPRITIETKIPVNEKIFKIKTATYELPENIVYKNKVLYYDSYHKEYTDNKNEWISAEDYLKFVLTDKNKKQKNNSNCL